MSKKKTKIIELTSVEALDATVGEVVRKKIEHTQTLAEMEAKIAAIKEEYAPKTGAQLDQIAALEGSVKEYCTVHRDAMFADKKSRETSSATIGFELTPHRVETAETLTQKDVVSRIQRIKNWALVYLRTPAPQLDKDALLKDREKLSPERQQMLGIEFAQGEQFFIRPKSEVAEDTVVKEAA